MKIAIYILAVILFVLGTIAILEGFGVLNLISSAHHIRFQLGGVLVDLVAIGFFVYAVRKK